MSSTDKKAKKARRLKGSGKGDGGGKSKKKKKPKFGIFQRRKHHKTSEAPEDLKQIMTPNPDDSQQSTPSDPPEEPKERVLTKREQIEEDIGPKYRYLHDIGAGAFGKVVKVERVRPSDAPKSKQKEFFAVKIVDKIFSSKAKAKRFLREVRTLRLLSSHESIVELVDIVTPSKPMTFNKLAVVFEAMPTDLKRIFKSKQYFSSLHIEYILYQILLGLQFVHSAGVVHRDLKPENIIIDEECTVRIIDFGLARGVKENRDHKEHDDIVIGAESKFLLGMDPDDENDEVSEPFDDEKDPLNEEQGAGPLADGDQAEEQRLAEKEKQRKLKKAGALTKHVVTRWYRSPEVILLQQERGYVYGVDVWSMGCIFAELLQMHSANCKDYKLRKVLFPGRTCFPFSTKDPFDYQHRTDQLRVVFNLIGTPSETEIARFKDKNVQIYLNNMTPSKPADLKAMFPGTSSHGIALLRDMLRFDVTKRISVEDALKSPYFDNVRDDAAETRHGKVESFEFEDIDVPLDKLRALILDEIMYFNPEWKNQLRKSLRAKQQYLKDLQQTEHQ